MSETYWHMHGQIKSMQCVIEAMVRLMPAEQRGALANEFAAHAQALEATLLNSPKTSEEQIGSIQHSLQAWTERLR
jgi:hypothetical protein